MTDDELADALAVLRANADQSKAMSREVGEAIAAHFCAVFEALTNNGLSREEAIYVAHGLTSEWQQLCWQQDDEPAAD